MIFTGKKGHIAKNCEMRGRCMECKQLGHFRRNCPIWHQQLLRLDEDTEALPNVEPSVVAQAESADGAGSRGSSQLVLDVVSGPSVGSLDGASCLVASPSSVNPLVVSPDGAG